MRRYRFNITRTFDQSVKSPILSLLACAFALTLLSCSNDNTDIFQGYVEGEFVYLSSSLGGKLTELKVKKGEKIRRGQHLFSLDHSLEKIIIAEAEANLNVAKSNLANLQKGARPSEIASIEARLAASKAGLELARKEYKRRQRLSKTSVTAEEELDKYRTNVDTLTHQVARIEAELATANMGARPDQIETARWTVKMAEAKLEQARWNLSRKIQYSPNDGVVIDLLHYPGEWVGPGVPVLSILPPENRKVRFYIPEPLVSSFQIGQQLHVSYDGAEETVSVIISYISPQAEYTPPVIYSSNSRAKLVFLLEASVDPAQAHLLKPGQPVDVSRDKKNFSRKTGRSSLGQRLYSLFQ